MTTTLPLRPGIRIALFTVIMAAHGATVFSWPSAPEPIPGTAPIAVEIVPLGETIIETPSTMASPAKMEKVLPEIPEKAPLQPLAEALSPAVEPPPVAPAIAEPPEPEQIRQEAEPVLDPQMPEADKAEPRREAKPARKAKAPPAKPPITKDRKIRHNAAPQRQAKTKMRESDSGQASTTIAGNRRGDRRGHAGATGMSRADYAAKVVAEFNRRKTYPQQARSNREQGSVGVSFVIGASGRVISYSITRSSGNAMLDRAVDAMMNSARLPPPPGGSFRGTFVARFTLSR